LKYSTTRKRTGQRNTTRTRNYGRFQLQIQEIIRQANVFNNQLAEIETIILQVEETYKMQIGGDIYSISEELFNIIYRDMERKAHHIQVLLADKLDQCKEKRAEIVNKHIKTLQKAYQGAYQGINIVQDKEKQKKKLFKTKKYFYTNSMQYHCHLKQVDHPFQNQS